MTNREMKQVLKWVEVDEETGENIFIPGTPDSIKQAYIKLCNETDDVIEEDS